MRPFIWLGALLVLPFDVALAGDKLWQDAEYGMSVSQVMHAVPGARASAADGTLHDGAKELLEGPDQEIAGHRFVPQFFFQPSGLEQVTLHLKDVTTKEDAQYVFEEVLKALRLKYGHETASESTSAMASVDFQAGSTNVSLVMFIIREPFMNIVYQRRVAENARKL